MNFWMACRTRGVLTGMVLAAASALAGAAEVGHRRVIVLDGTWQLAEGTMAQAPVSFDHTVPVPGLVSLAKPALADVGLRAENREYATRPGSRREAFWYRRTFRCDDAIPDVAILKIHKSMYTTRVILNGVCLGDQLHNFTPGYFDAKPALRVGENELLVRLGADLDAAPKYQGGYRMGFDLEKGWYIPGIYDSVELILSGSPHMARVQAVPHVADGTVDVHAWVRPADALQTVNLKVTVREVKSGRIAGTGAFAIVAGAKGSDLTGSTTIAIADCRLWSPERPFLYELEVDSGADTLRARFGMREFRLDPATGRAVLNGKPYFMRGSNVCIFRFMEDKDCLDHPWREEWVRRFHKKLRDMHWNCLRYCIGFPPESWYRIADEEGILIQDEFPLWDMPAKPGDFDPDRLAAEYREWVEERWNHPSVVIWDACNETRSPDVGKAIGKVLGLDFSNRPWDDGWGPAMAPGDSRELHPYHFSDPKAKLSCLAKYKPLGWSPGKSPIIVNEYGGLWRNRDGSATCISRFNFENLLGPESTTAQRRQLYARITAAETEYWRCHRECAAVMQFDCLSLSRPLAPGAKLKPVPGGWREWWINTQVFGCTSDEWIDVEKLTWEPEFLRYVGDAFSPVGLMIDAFAEEYPPETTLRFPVVLINDLDEPWKGTVRVRLLCRAKILQEKTEAAEIPALGSQTVRFAVDIPGRSGTCQIEAALIRPGAKPVCSLRDFQVAAVVH